MPLSEDQVALFGAIKSAEMTKITILTTKHRLKGKRRVGDNIYAILDEDGLSPIHIAAQQYSPAILSVLLKNYPSIDINYCCGQVAYAALHLAAKAGRLATMQLLLSHKADINVLNSQGEPPLFVAIRANFFQGVTWLLRKKASLTVRNTAGQSAVDVAIETNQIYMVEALLENGFDLEKMYGQESKAVLLQNVSAEMRQLLTEYFSIMFVDYTQQEQFSNLDALNQQQLIQLRMAIVQESAKILDANTVRLLEHLQQRIAIKSYPQAVGDYANKIDLNGKSIDQFTISEQHYYLYVPAVVPSPAALIPIPQGLTQAEIINKLMTGLVYESRHYQQTDSPIHVRKMAICWISPRYLNFDFERFASEIARRETASGSYFGEELSDDSDDESVDDPDPHWQAYQISANAHNTVGISFFKNELKTILASSEAALQEKVESRTDKVLRSKQLNARVVMPYTIQQAPFDVSKARNDLTILNRHLKNGIPIERAVAKVGTKFFVAQYRGVAYDLSWNAPSRRAHRQDDETKLPYYSRSVSCMAGFNLTREYSAKKHRELQPLLKILGDKLQVMLYAMHNTLDVSNGKYAFDSLADLVQDAYSKHYQGFHDSLKSTGGFSQYVGVHFLNDKNPFVSTADRPYHALRYAFGAKPYAKNERNRLRPRWNEQGRAERPYAGKFYISLHPLTDYNRHYPMHLTSLVRQGKSNVANIILAERETTFPAMLPADRVVYQLVARYPSFKNLYHAKYKEKYGLDKDAYDLFATAFKDFPPHSNGRRYVKKLLGNWLSAYHEFRVIHIANQEAIKRGGVLLYQNDDGGFSMELPACGIRKERDSYPEMKLTRQYRQG